MVKYKLALSVITEEHTTANKVTDTTMLICNLMLSAVKN